MRVLWRDGWVGRGTRKVAAAARAKKRRRQHTAAAAAAPEVAALSKSIQVNFVTASGAALLLAHARMVVHPPAYVASTTCMLARRVQSALESGLYLWPDLDMAYEAGEGRKSKPLAGPGNNRWADPEWRKAELNRRKNILSGDGENVPPPLDPAPVPALAARGGIMLGGGQGNGGAFASARVGAGDCDEFADDDDWLLALPSPSSDASLAD